MQFTGVGGWQLLAPPLRAAIPSKA